MKTINKKLISITIILFVISILSLYSFSNYIDSSYIYKQIIFYIFGLTLILIINKINIKYILSLGKYIYFINVILLLAVLFFGININGTRAWFNIGILGTLQPSEFMKIGLILYISEIISKSKIKTIKDELILIIKTLIITIIPSILTFLEPDTGAVIIYIVILFTLLFVSGIRNIWFYLIGIITITIIITILYIYFTNKDLFISIFGSSMFYRIDRLTLWKNKEGMQLSNSLIAIGASGFFGKLTKTTLYYPEGATDFIFTSFISLTGFIGSIILIIVIYIFIFELLKIASKKKYKYIIIGFTSTLIFSYLWNISMTLGLVPIIGITLPFISYGGSSLISNMIMLGITLNIESQKYNNIKTKYLRF